MSTITQPKVKLSDVFKDMSIEQLVAKKEAIQRASELMVFDSALDSYRLKLFKVTNQINDEIVNKTINMVNQIDFD